MKLKSLIIGCLLAVTLIGASFYVFGKPLKPLPVVNAVAVPAANSGALTGEFTYIIYAFFNQNKNTRVYSEGVIVTSPDVTNKAVDVLWNGQEWCDGYVVINETQQKHLVTDGHVFGVEDSGTLKGWYAGVPSIHPIRK